MSRQNQDENDQVDVVVRLSNRTARFERPYPIARLKPYFRYHPNGYIFSPAYRAHQWDGFKVFLSRDSVPAGLFLARKKEIQEKTGIHFSVIDERKSPAFKAKRPWSSRKAQVMCLDMMLKAKTGGIVLGATGTGKTRQAAMYFACMKGCAVFIVDDLGLLDQTKRALEKYLDEKVGIIG